MKSLSPCDEKRWLPLLEIQEIQLELMEELADRKAKDNQTTGSNYWLLIEAWQHGIPDWGIALGTGGNGICFRRTAGVGDYRYY